MTGANDDQFRKVMAEGYARYRAMGTKTMRIRELRILPMDEHHCIAHVDWTATYARKGRSDVEIDFAVHYLVQKLEGDAKVFGWITGDEQALLRAHGIPVSSLRSCRLGAMPGVVPKKSPQRQCWELSKRSIGAFPVEADKKVSAR